MSTKFQIYTCFDEIYMTNTNMINKFNLCDTSNFLFGGGGYLFSNEYNDVGKEKENSQYVMLFISQLTLNCLILFSLICLSHKNKQNTLEHINETF